MTDVTEPTPDAPRSPDPAAAPPRNPFEATRPTSQRERNRRGEGEKLRRELLEHGLELLSEAGNPEDVSIRAIARRTGVSATAAYRHFVDRDDLVFCATGLAFEQFTAALTEEVARAEDPFERLSAAGRAYRDFATEHQGRYRALFSNPMRCPATTSATDEEIDATSTAFALLVDLVRDCLDAGAPAASRGASAEYLAFQMWTWIHGIVDLRITHPDTDFPDAAQMFLDAQELLGLDRPR